MDIDFDSIEIKRRFARLGKLATSKIVNENLKDICKMF